MEDEKNIDNGNGAANGTSQNESAQDSNETLEFWKVKAEEYLNGWKRAKADYINLKRDTDRDKMEIIEFANALFIGELLPIIDNFTKALDEANKSARDEKKDWLTGFGHIAKSFQDILAKRGITKIDALGKLFDPNFHEAVGHEKEEGKKAGVIIREVEAGYLLRDKVLRPAKVVVSE